MSSKALLALAAALLAWQSGSSVAQTVRRLGPLLVVSNTSRYVGDGRWDWTVFLQGALVTADQIQCVEYTLDPSFPNPVRRVCIRGKDPDHAFALSSNGWGEFKIGVRIFFRDGKQQRLSYPLKLTK